MLSIEELTYLDSTVTQIIVNTGVSRAKLTVLDLSRFSLLKVLEIGDHCFCYVKEVKLIGLNKLESVEIGKNSFTMKRGGSIPDLEFSTVPFDPILFCSKRGNSDMSGFVRSSCGI